MRGFAFIGGDGPEKELDLGLRRDDLIVAADSGLLAVEARGLRADWIVGDMDSLPDLSLLSRYPEERIKTFPAAKDDTDTEIALRLLRELGCDEEVVIVGGGGGRLDHTLAIAALFERDEAPDRWITRLETVSMLDACRRNGIVSIRTKPGSLLSIFPAGSGPWRISSRGLKWPLDGLSWNRGRFGVSNVALSAECELTAAEGRFLAVASLEAEFSAPVRSSRKPV